MFFFLNKFQFQFHTFCTYKLIIKSKILIFNVLNKNILDRIILLSYQSIKNYQITEFYFLKIIILLFKLYLVKMLTLFKCYIIIHSLRTISIQYIIFKSNDWLNFIILKYILNKIIYNDENSKLKK